MERLGKLWRDVIVMGQSFKKGSGIRKFLGYERW
jgi:hypothetical protein